MASITFDDGYANQYQNGRPLLNARGLKATYYLIGDAFSWSGHMNGTMAQQLASEGNELGNHTMNHPNLTTLSASQTATEFANAQSAIIAQTGVTPTTCAYPYGASNSTVTNTAAQYFKACRTTDGGLNTAANYAPYSLKMFYVLSNTTAAQVQAAAANAKATNSWVIFVYHGVTPGTPSSTYDVSATNLAAQLDAIKSTNIPVYTVAGALAAVGK